MTVEKLTKNWQQAKYQQVVKQLSTMPKEIVLETLVCVADEVTPAQRLGLLEKIDEDLVSDGAVLALLGL
ncbi:MAG: hypothetical protein KME05_12185 [Gloeocapsa sp. UFS-A4-WI-NPMV-4B04]|jgi:hypothetical protein|nr:hypothetical protein [Gloeocapsa sp. UFS-A4-WI-NPMV-4B04]